MFMKCKVTVDTSHYPKEVPWELPEGWCWRYLSDIGTWQSGATPSRGVKAYFGGSIPWLKTGDLNDDYVKVIPERITDKALKETSVKLNPEGSVLIAMYGVTIGKVGILTFPATTNQACCACSELCGVDNRFLFYFLISHKEEFIRLAGGGAQPNISKEIIVNTPIPVPPAEEQKRIVSVIEMWLGVLKDIDKSSLFIHAGINNCKARILDLAIHGKLVPQDPSDEPAIELLKRINPNFTPSDNLHYEGDFPNGWVLASLGEISNYGHCISVPVEKIGNDDWVLELEDIEKDNGRILQRLSKKDRKISGIRHQFKKGQILYSKLRTYLNKVLIADEDGFCTTEIIPITPIDGVNALFLIIVLRSQYFLDYTQNCCYGVKMPRLGTNDAKKAFIPLPPFEEQGRIVAAVKGLFLTITQIGHVIENQE